MERALENGRSNPKSSYLTLCMQSWACVCLAADASIRTCLMPNRAIFVEAGSIYSGACGCLTTRRFGSADSQQPTASVTRARRPTKIEQFALVSCWVQANAHTRTRAQETLRSCHHTQSWTQLGLIRSLNRQFRPQSYAALDIMCSK